MYDIDRIDTQEHSVTASETRRKQLHDSTTIFCRLSSAGTILGTCFGAVLRATLGDPVGLPKGKGSKAAQHL